MRGFWSGIVNIDANDGEREFNVGATVHFNEDDGVTYLHLEEVEDLATLEWLEIVPDTLFVQIAVAAKRAANEDLDSLLRQHEELLNDIVVEAAIESALEARHGR